MKENLKLYPNQRVYRVYHNIDSNGNNIIIDKQDSDVAFQILTRIEFYIWLDMMSLSENTTYAFSPQLYRDRIGISVSAGKQAFSALIAKGFAVAVDSTAYKIFSKSSKEEFKKYYDTNDDKIKEDDIRWE